MPEERSDQPQQDNERNLERLTGAVQKTLETADLVNRTVKSSSGLLELANRFSRASRKTLGGVAGSSLCLLLWSTSAPVSGLQKILLAPFAGAFGGSISALVIPESLEEKRRRRLNELETIILYWQETDPELIAPLKQEYIALASANGNELRQLLLHPSQPLPQNVLPPGN